MHFTYVEQDSTHRSKMQSPNLHSGTYSIETNDDKILRFDSNEAHDEAVNIQQSGKDVEVWENGFLKYKLHGIHQYDLFK